MYTTINNIKDYARELRLSGLAVELEPLLEDARRQLPAYSDFALSLLHTEILCRRKAKLEWSTKTAQLPLLHDLDKYDHSFVNGIIPAQLKQLRQLLWLTSTST